MSYTFNTGNPVGPNGSADARDLVDNSQVVDRLINGTELTAPDRLGVARKTRAGMEQDFYEFLEGTSFELPPIQYVDGQQITVQRPTQLIERLGVMYSVTSPSTFPVVLSGAWSADESLLTVRSDQSLRQELANGTAFLVDSTVVGNEGASLDSILSLDVFSWVHKYGAKLDGVTDDGPAIRMALDNIPVTGGELIFPPGSQIKVIGTIYIPQRISSTTVEGQGIRLIGNNSQIIGDGSSVVFESGTGNYSTVALGGATNWTQPNEGAGTIHYNSAIIGFNFKSCGTPIKLKNWLHGCVLEKLYATDFTGRMIWTNRCFYLAQRDIQGRPFREDRADTMPIFQYDDTNNTMTFDSVHGSGISPSGQSKGVVFQFDAGVQGVELPPGCSAEGAKIGLHLKSIVYSMAVMGVYFELCDVAVKSTAANLSNLVIDYCEFEDNPVDIDVDNWVDGYFGSANKNEGAVIFGSNCTHTVHLPNQTLSNLTHTTWKAKPDGWTVPGGCQVVRNDMIFNADNGFAAAWFRNTPAASGGAGVVPLAYTGECFNVGGVIPYCSVTITTGTLTIDTKIGWNPNLAAVRFDVSVAHSQLDVISGVLTCNNTVRLDPGNPAGITVSAVDNGGFLRLVLSGFSVSGITGYSGKVRVL